MNAVRSPAPVFTNIVNRANSAVNSVVNRVNTAIPAKSSFSWLPSALVALIVLSVTGVLIYYNEVIYYTISDYYNIVHDYFYPPPPPPPPMPKPKPSPPKPNPISPGIASIVESTLPERRQVFNISDNRYTFYDAEPLCKALGAEIATYDQVKKAYQDGGDWCNYGWSAGQMALYPTQADTWKKLQAGPEDQRTSCGQVGVNGGYFDNPELRFGVNCFGAKPPQKNHDAAIVSNNDNYPSTPETVEFDKKVAKYKSITNTVGILPFKKYKWSA